MNPNDVEKESKLALTHLLFYGEEPLSSALIMYACVSQDLEIGFCSLVKNGYIEQDKNTHRFKITDRGKKLVIK